MHTLPELKAQTQYNDFTGEVAIDQGMNPSFYDLQKRLGLPTGCLTVGFSVYAAAPCARDGWSQDEQVLVRLLVVDADHAEAAGGSLAKVVAAGGTVPVFFSEPEWVPIAGFLALIHRIEIVAISRCVRPDKLKVLPNR
jgi:hypothetical protein